MVIRTLVGGALLALLLCSTSFAAPVTVNLRVEGSTQTYFEGPVTTDAKQVTTAAGGTHTCNGLNGGKPGPAGPTQTTALDDAKLPGGFDWDGKYDTGYDDFFIERVGTDGAVSGPFTGFFWGTSRNWVGSMVGGCQERVFSGDEVLFAWTDGGPILRLSTGQTRVATGQPVNVAVQQYDFGGTATPAAGAAVQGQKADAGGNATIAFDSPGVKRFKATKTGAIRSNAVEVCVEAPGSGSCSGFTPSLGSTPRDTTKPRGRLTSPRSGKRYRRGPRLLKGIARDEGGVKDVRLRLNWIGPNGCQYFEGAVERFSKRSRCKRTTFFSVGDDAAWSYLLPDRLAPGRYTLTLKILDRGNNSTLQRVRFTVLG